MTNGQKTWIVVGGVLGFLVGSLWLAAGPADADRTVVLSSSEARITHGQWFRLEDAGFRYTVCGETVQTDGGASHWLEAPCITCEPGSWGSAPTTCVAAWKAANGL